MRKQLKRVSDIWETWYLIFEYTLCEEFPKYYIKLLNLNIIRIKEIIHVKCMYAPDFFSSFLSCIFYSSIKLKYFHSFFRKQNFIDIHISLFQVFFSHKFQSYSLFVLLINKRLFLFFFHNHFKVEKSTKKI
jgi:hypothetical protein